MLSLTYYTKICPNTGKISFQEASPSHCMAMQLLLELISILVSVMTSMGPLYNNTHTIPTPWTIPHVSSVYDTHVWPIREGKHATQHKAMHYQHAVMAVFNWGDTICSGRRNVEEYLHNSSYPTRYPSATHGWTSQQQVHPGAALPKLSMT